MAEETATAIPPTKASVAPGNRRPEYPAAARQHHLEGRLVLRVDFTDAGNASAVAVSVSSGHAMLDQAALDAVRAWLFNPATKAGKPIAGVIYVPIEFRMFD